MSMSEEAVFFHVGDLRLEGRLWRAPGPCAVVLSHPHPLYGGALDNPVVAVLTEVYQRLGYSTLRFNFRGVGASEGDYDDGRGERDDLRAAVALLEDLGKTSIDLAGYSFGAWISLHLDPLPATVRRLLLVAPPVAYLEFEAKAVAPSVAVQAIVGDQDQFAPLGLLREQMSHWQSAATLNVLPGADHFYGNTLDRLAALVEVVLKAS